MAAQPTDVLLVEKIIDSGFGQRDGKRYYKVKWTRYTWEPEESLHIKKNLLDQFWSEHGGDPNILTKEKSSAATYTDTTSVKEQKTSKDDLTVGITSNANVINCQQATTLDLLPNTQRIEGNVALPNEVQNVIANAVGCSSTTIQQETTVDVSNSFEDDDGKGIKFISLDKHTCDICYRSYSSTQSLKTHQKTHQPERSFQCETCFKCFAERSTLKRHMYIHLEVKPFKCDDCDRAFSDKSTLRRHIITHTGAKRFECPNCNKRFTRNEHLRQHMYIHTCQKLYECEICHKTFRQRSTRKNHMILHRADTGFKCETCGEVFGRQTLYDKHVICCMGSQEDSFKCDDCDKRFQDRNGLKRHHLIHTGERPFKCDHCEQTFNDRSVLRRHSFMHTDRKPHQCSICQKDFVRKSSLNTHMASQHPTEQTVFELVQPVSYNIPESIALAQQNIEQHVQFVLHNPETAENVNGDVEVSSTKMRNDGVSILAQAVCNVPHDVLQSGTTVDSNTICEKMQNTSSGEDSASGHLQLQLDQENSLQPGDNQLVQVQIIRMEDGNQFVQSIQAIVQGDEKDYREPDLVVDESHVISINESPPVNESHVISINESGTVNESHVISINESPPVNESHAMSINESGTNSIIMDDSHSAVSISTVQSAEEVSSTLMAPSLVTSSCVPDSYPSGYDTETFVVNATSDNLVSTTTKFPTTYVVNPTTTFQTFTSVESTTTTFPTSVDNTTTIFPISIDNTTTTFPASVECTTTTFAPAFTSVDNAITSQLDESAITSNGIYALNTQQEPVSSSDIEDS